MVTGHHLFCGEFASLEPRFLARVTALKKRDPLAPVEVLAGSNLLSVYLRRRAAEELGAVVNLRFVTFLDLAREMVSGGDPRPPLPALGGPRLAFRAMAETPEAEAFGELRGRRSLAQALLSTFGDLREAGVPRPWSDVLPEAAPELSQDRRAFLFSVGATLDRLADLHAPYQDADSVLERAAAEGRASAGGPLFVYGLWDLGGTRARLLARVAANRSVEAFIPHSEGEGDTAARGTALFAGLLGVNPEMAAAPAVGPRPVAVLAPSEGAEAREVVRELLRAVDEGMPLHRCAVLLRHPLRQEPPLVAELRLRGLPFFRPPGTGFALTPAARAALTIADLAADDVPRERFEELADLLDALDALGALPAGLSAVRVGTLLGRAGWFGGSKALTARLERLERVQRERRDRAPEGDEERARKRVRAEKELAGLRDFCARVLGALPSPAPAPWRTHAERLDAAFDRVLGRAARPLAEAVDALAALEAVEPGPVPFADAVALLPEALDLVPVPHGRFERDGVAILSLVSARGLLFDHVLVPGLSEGSFPAAPRPDPLLFDRERQSLRKRTGAPLAERAGTRHLEGERFLFETASRSARKRLVLLAPTRDETDRERLPSTYLRELPSLAGASADDLRDVAKAAARGVRRVPLGRLAPDAVALDAGEAFRFARARNGSLARSPLAPAPVAAALVRAKARDFPRFTEFEGRLGRATPLLTLVGKVVSASLLEGLATCPYRTLLTRGLGLEEPESASPPLVPDPRDLGSLAHEVLRDLTADLIARGGSFTASLDAEATRLSAQAVERWAEKTGCEPPPVLLAQAAERVVSLVTLVLDHESAEGTRPAGAEVRFGFALDESSDRVLSRVEPVELEAGGRTLKLRGQIDRVDLAEGRALVVDYKFGKSDPYGATNRNDYLLVRGERLQLPIYALAAKAVGALEVTSEFLFVRASDGEPTPIVFGPAQTEESIARLAEAAGILAEACEAGDFLPKPEGLRQGDNCAMCAVADVCGGGHQIVFERKWEGDGASSPLARLEAIK